MHRTPRNMSRSTSLAVIWASYLWTIVVALTIGWLLPIESPLIKAGVVDLIATVMIFALGADAGYWWTIFGPTGMTILFLVVSLPLIEARMQQRRGDYDRVCAEVSKLIPWFPKGR